MTDDERRQADSDRRQQLQIQGDTINADVGLMHEREERIVQLEVSGIIFFRSQVRLGG